MQLSNITNSLFNSRSFERKVRVPVIYDDEVSINPFYDCIIRDHSTFNPLIQKPDIKFDKLDKENIPLEEL